jgi:hypothetical protein
MAVEGITREETEAGVREYCEAREERKSFEAVAVAEPAVAVAVALEASVEAVDDGGNREEISTQRENGHGRASHSRS